MNSSKNNNMTNNTNNHVGNHPEKAKPDFWTYFAITMTIVAGMLSSNLKAEATPASSFNVEVIGSGKPVIMIPGLMSDARVWRPTAEALAGDFPQHGITIANATLEFNPQARHFIMLDQPDWLTAQIAKALKD